MGLFIECTLNSISPPSLSPHQRFDLVFILMDRPDDALDHCVSEHVLAMHSGMPGVTDLHTLHIFLLILLLRHTSSITLLYISPPFVCTFFILFGLGKAEATRQRLLEYRSQTQPLPMLPYSRCGVGKSQFIYFLTTIHHVQSAWGIQSTAD